MASSSSRKDEVKNLLMELQRVEDGILAHREGEDAYSLHRKQGRIFCGLCDRTKNNDVKFTFEMAAVECFSQDSRLSVFCARPLKHMAEQIGSVLYYKKSAKKAIEFLSLDKSVPDSQDGLQNQKKRHAIPKNMIKVARYGIATLKTSSVEDAESKMAASETCSIEHAESEVAASETSSVKIGESKVAASETSSVKDVESKTSDVEDAESKVAASETSSVRTGEPKVSEIEKSPDLVTDNKNGLRLYWVGLDINIRRDFMKVNIAELKSFAVQRCLNKQFLFMGKEGLATFEDVISSAREDKKWTFWICRTLCSEKFSSAEKFKSHLEKKHAADIKPSLEKDRVKRMGKDWARKIISGGWEPVDAEAAVGMIKNQLADVKAFASNSKYGWSKEWPSAADEERSNLLKKIKLLLVSFCEHKVLPCSIRDWLMRFTLKHLGELQVSEQNLIDSRLKETPQSICFLERRELIQILDFLKTIECNRNDGTYVVCRAVDRYLGYMQVKEKIDLDKKLSYLLLDKRLLKSNNAQFNDEGTISIIDDPNEHYTKAHARGDDIISWLADYSSVDNMFPRTIREHNIDIWLAVMKAVQFTSRTLGDKYAKKMQYLGYEEALTDVENLCMSEPEGRRNLEGDQWNRYASLLCDRCEAIVDENSLSTKLYLCAVRDVLERASKPRLDFPKDCLHRIRRRVHKHKLVLNHLLEHINLLKSFVIHKVLLIDSKILLVDNSRNTLLDSLIRLSVFDNRVYMLRLLKPFLLNKIRSMKSDAAEAELLHEEEKKNSQALKKKNKRNKTTSKSMPSTLDKTVEHEPSANLVPEGTSPSLKALASEMGQLEISSNTDNQEEATEDLQNTPGEDKLPEQLESAPGGAAAIYNSALDMTLKALLNIKLLEEDLKHNEQPSYDHREEQITCALQKVFAAFKLGVLEGVYGVLLSDLLTSIKEKQPSMSGSAAELFVSILQFWPCCKDPETESLVDRFFMLEENERMSCRKCRREPNYPEQRSYGIVMAADSIRDLKCAFGNMKFVDILKLIRMENKMLCDSTKGGCGEKNFVQHFMSTIPRIFTIVLEWEKSETGKEISETTKALEWEIDISSIYEDLDPNTNYRLVSMVGCGEEDEHICLAYGNNGWVNVMRDSLAKEDVGNWESMIRFCGERMVRPEILFYEGVWASSDNIGVWKHPSR